MAREEEQDEIIRIQLFCDGTNLKAGPVGHWRELVCDYSSSKEALRLGTSSATAGAQGLRDICPCLIRGLAEGRVGRVNDKRDYKRHVSASSCC